MRILTTPLLLALLAGAGPAFAQGVSAPPATSAPDTAATPQGAAEQNQGGFITYREGDQLLGSGLMGAQVFGADSERIGEVTDLLLDREGRVIAVVVGIGGFLGLGEKDVAIGNDRLEFVLSQDVASARGTGPRVGSPTAQAPGTAATGTGTASSDAPATGNAAASGSRAAASSGLAGVRTGTMNTGWNWGGGNIDHIQVDATRQQLQDAPAFETTRGG
ncbi:PRC-barrel domain-containing protein [Aureimonas jatrophae]|uniref:PRC-barrel domain-containing protein n=1 Tax=Aureimonas jatrophae TaxID=1166073 RepID=A0A1H0KPL9_9HYPH|nr:PRC-barrel domain-containing protein [Aureimonas jatrophae]MBB3948810.1 sporulation protein YlmC with PRC-barrel domain [Aureimonas jatrophae]SDO57795.1 PRC-barrel domain-containing protein [Aureimonas jatrophae]